MEDRELRDCIYNKRWILTCHYDMNRVKLLRNIIPCSGSLIGGVKPFMAFVEMLITYPEWLTAGDMDMTRATLITFCIPNSWIVAGMFTEWTVILGS
jgi:hypothetical protein